MYQYFKANEAAASRTAAIGAENQSKTAMEAGNHIKTAQRTPTDTHTVLRLGTSSKSTSSKGKYFVIACFALLAANVFFANAQDVITLKNGEEIQAKVTDITVTEIKYKLFDNLDGPTIVIPKQDVFFINYENGMREVLHDETATQAQPTRERPAQPQVVVPAGTLFANTIIVGRLATDIEMNANNLNANNLRKRKFFLQLINELEILSPDEVRYLLASTNALQMYNKGFRRSHIGGVTAFSGICILAGSGTISIIQAINDERRRTGKTANRLDLDDAIYSLLWAGGVTMLTGIIFVGSGHNQISKSITVYNNSLSNQTTGMELKFGIVGNGVGVALRF